MKLLTIIVPTYNRAEFLGRLLLTLGEELLGHENLVDLIIGDNASTDHTPLVINTFLNTYSETKIIRHLENLGPDENFCKCIDVVNTPFFWIIGDDDMPKKNVISKVLKFLSVEKPDLLYLNSEWMPIISNQNDGGKVHSLKIRKVSRDEFASQVNVWITFISGMIVNLEKLQQLKPHSDIRKYKNTNLGQLGWVLPLLMKRSNFYITSEQCVLATSGNTGGYKLLTVFGINFPMILDQECGRASSVRNSIISALVWRFLPGLIWGIRKSKLSNFYDEDHLEALSAFKDGIVYWLIYYPLIKFPKYIAFPIWASYRLFKKLNLLPVYFYK